MKPTMMGTVAGEAATDALMSTSTGNVPPLGLMSAPRASMDAAKARMPSLVVCTEPKRTSRTCSPKKEVATARYRLDGLRHARAKRGNKAKK